MPFATSGFIITPTRGVCETGSSPNYSYAATNHRLSAVGNKSRSYDPSGNTTAIGSGGQAQKFVYDDRNRLRDYKVGNNVRASYRYNGKGEQVLRIDTTMAANSRQYLYDEAGRLLGEYTTAGTRIQEYVWLDDILVGVLSSHDGGAFQYVETDHLGTPRAVVNPANNAIIWRWNMNDTAFGDHAPLGDPDGNGQIYTLQLRYPGQRADPISGLNYNYFRDYDPGTGRYLQPDPIGLAGGMSTYGYVGGHPLSAFDPLGLAEWHVESLVLQDIPKTAFGFIPYGRQRRALFSMHSECFTKTRGGLLSEERRSSEMFAPVIKVDDFKNLSVERPYWLTATNFTLNDGIPGAPDPMNLGGRATISFTVAGGVVTGSVSLGKARGTFTAQTRLTADGSYKISGDVDMAPFWEGSETCDCAARH